jgi:hypothetical protein
MCLRDVISTRLFQRPKVTARIVDTRNTKISRGCVRPHVTAGSQWEDPCFPREMAMEGSSLEGRSYCWMRPKVHHYSYIFSVDYSVIDIVIYYDHAI